MSPQNCSAKMSPPRIRSSPQKRRRPDERMGAEGESERSASRSCRATDDGRTRDGGKGRQTVGDLCTSDEAVAAKDARARRASITARQAWQSREEQYRIREGKSSSCPGTGVVIRD